MIVPSPQHLPTLVVDIQTMGHRIFVSDVQESVHFVRYKPIENQLVIFADETYQRSVLNNCYCSTSKAVQMAAFQCGSWSCMWCVKNVSAHTCRFMTCCCILDYNTVAAADKFGNIAVVGGNTCEHPVPC